ncbi:MULTISPECIES: polysaccharide biosynthesis tyrosine autokinase [unclassified Pseudoalteromonas]|uniref:polysaccharide biosynthesis tyrosine autokinase n=1 Tax=unclassified Pseudoalteromonas TaxID=194690 RepID=UPI0020980A07|nr:polysaccharide biosynthesis tyrosine autokinase [Pseudoalteromonas sp. XMcav2-N]MCO7188739.1 polysaccharide biosynthesis tyrosine autokinase [Pseudoalteromonas sp. XMcav2-N]
MNAQPNMISSSTPKSSSSNSHEIDLLSLFGILLDRKLLIVIVTVIFAGIGIAHAIFSTPIYQASAVIQVEEKGGTVPGFDELGIFQGASAAVTEIELLKSRTVIGEVVDLLQLDTTVSPKLFPVIGNRAFRKFNPSYEGELAEPSFGATSYAWGGEKIDIFAFEVPSFAIGQGFLLRVGENNTISLIGGDEEVLLSGKVGDELASDGFKLTVRSLVARPGTEFGISKQSRLLTIIGLQSSIVASERGKDSGIINLNLQHSDPKYAKDVLNKIAELYVQKNVERNSAEAQKSLDFLEVQLPSIKKSLESAEERFNEYQVRQQSVDISLETQAVLEQIVALETKLQELDLKKLEMSRKFTKEHPSYRGVIEQITALSKEKDSFSSQVALLPETQQELLRLKRDVEVNSEIYTLLLAKAQELDIVRAGTVGNTRIVDEAEVNTYSPVKPKKSLIVVMYTLLGFALAVAIVVLQKMVRRGIEDPAEIEALGLPVYASVPFSEYQLKLTGFARARKDKTLKSKSILAVDNPADLSIEALRSLRTSLHFAMLEAKNNIIAISGPSPGVGKSFISVNLATVLAQSGKKVLIIDADMRKGYLHTQFGISWNCGLSDLLSGEKKLDEVIRKSQVEHLDIITRGQVPPNPSELLMHPNFSALIDEVTSRYDLILVDTPPILAVTDPAIVSAHAGTTILVTRFGQNQVKELALTRSRFEQNGVEVRGVVFNGVVKKASNAYGYYGYYNYEYKSDK